MSTWVCLLPESIDTKVFQRLVHIRMETVSIARLPSMLQRHDISYIIVKTRQGFLPESVEVIKENFPTVSVLWLQTAGESARDSRNKHADLSVVIDNCDNTSPSIVQPWHITWEMVRDLLLSNGERRSAQFKLPHKNTNTTRSAAATTTAELNIISSNRAGIKQLSSQAVKVTKNVSGTSATTTTTKSESTTSLASTTSILATSSSTEIKADVDPLMKYPLFRRRNKSTPKKPGLGISPKRSGRPVALCLDYYSALTFTFDVAKQVYA